jgi:hypothetical protein
MVYWQNTFESVHVNKSIGPGVAQVVVYLPSKCEALSSNSSTTKKKESAGPDSCKLHDPDKSLWSLISLVGRKIYKCQSQPIKSLIILQHARLSCIVFLPY